MRYPLCVIRYPLSVIPEFSRDGILDSILQDAPTIPECQQPGGVIVGIEMLSMNAVAPELRLVKSALGVDICAVRALIRQLNAITYWQ